MSASTTKRTTERILAAIIVLGLVLSVVFGLGAVRGARRMHGGHRQALMTDVQEIRGWMTVPYIAKAYRLAPEDIYKAAAIPSLGSGRKSLQALNEELFPGRTGVVVQKVRDAVRLGLEARTLREKRQP